MARKKKRTSPPWRMPTGGIHAEGIHARTISINLMRDGGDHLPQSLNANEAFEKFSAKSVEFKRYQRAVAGLEKVQGRIQALLTQQGEAKEDLAAEGATDRLSQAASELPGQRAAEQACLESCSTARREAVYAVKRFCQKQSNETTSLALKARNAAKQALFDALAELDAINQYSDATASYLKAYRAAPSFEDDMIDRIVAVPPPSELQSESTQLTHTA